jgi:aspartyl-tRNA(Asn)/glutamyl-tRNA(Gln) amidotransferase subunit A
MELCDRPLHELHALRLVKQVSTEEIARSVLARIEAVEPRIHAYITLTTEGLLDRARNADAKIARGAPTSVIDGMPLAIKDVFCTKGVLTTCGSHILKGFVPPYDATAVMRLRANGLTLAGKTNMDEFAMGSSTENSAYGPTRNPWDLTRVPGGSSGGSAAAVAAGEALAALGTDTGGSIRQPASFTSLVGLKPTYGRVSRYGMVAYASSLDQGGPLTRDVTDAALLLEMIAGSDPRDSTSAERPVPRYSEGLVGGVKGFKIGLIREIQGPGLPVQGAGRIDAEVSRQFQDNLKTLESLGARTVEISLPHLDYAIAVYYILAPSEASSNLGRYDGVRFGLRETGDGSLEAQYKRTREAGFGAEVKRRVMLGTFALSAGYYDAYYNRAMKIRELLRRDFARSFAEVDLIALPTSPVPPFKIGAVVDDPLQMYLMDAFTLPVNLAGLPGISLPGGFTASGLPLGFQLVGAHFEEEKLLRAAKAFEDATEHHKRRPKLELPPSA